MSRLARGYRLLLRTYPPGRRRAELLDTFMEATDAGRPRPTLHAAGNLLWWGMRARLGRPMSSGVIVLATLIAAITGFGGAAVAARLALELVPGYPAGPALTAIAGSVFPGLPTVGAPSAHGLFLDQSPRSATELAFWGHDEDFEFSTLEISPAARFIPGDIPAWTAGVRDRLVAAGWQVGGTAPSDEGRAFVATRDGLAMTVMTTTEVVDNPPGSFFVTATLDRIPPGYVTAATLLGLLAGALAGWLTVGWASRRTEDAVSAARGLTLIPAILTVMVMLPQTIVGFVRLASQLFSADPLVQPFWALSVTWGYGCTFLSVVLLVLSIVAAAVGGSPAYDPAAGDDAGRPAPLRRG